MFGERAYDRIDQRIDGGYDRVLVGIRTHRGDRRKDIDQILFVAFVQIGDPDYYRIGGLNMTKGALSLPKHALIITDIQVKNSRSNPEIPKQGM